MTDTTGDQNAVGDNSVPVDATPAPTPRIFINYRHEDTAGEALLLYDRLASRFNPADVFLDVISIGAGEEWLKQIRAHGAHGGAFLALIGGHWLVSLKERTLELESGDAPNEDYVRREIEWALRDWPGEVIPVLVGTAMPNAQTLPKSIRAITSKQAVELRHRSFDDDVEALIKKIEAIALKARPSDYPGSSDVEIAEFVAEAPPAGAVGAPTSVAPIELPSGVMAPGADHFEEVVGQLLRGTVVPILGSHVWGSIPDSGELATYLAGELDLPELAQSVDLAEVAQYAAVTIGDSYLYRAVRKAIRERQPIAVQRFLAGLPKQFETQGLEPMYQLILTSNYDNALEQAFEDEHEPFDLAIYMAKTGQFVHYPWSEDATGSGGVAITTPENYSGFPIDVDEGDLQRTVIVKIHGGTDGSVEQLHQGEDYVLTEDQYIDYFPTEDIRSVVPVQILQKLRDSHNLFLGYRMRNWNERIFLRRLWHKKPLKEKSWAIDGRPDSFERDGWRMYPFITLFGASLPDYVGHLSVQLQSSRSPTHRTT